MSVSDSTHYNRRRREAEARKRMEQVNAVSEAAKPVFGSTPKSVDEGSITQPVVPTKPRAKK